VTPLPLYALSFCVFRLSTCLSVARERICCRYRGVWEATTRRVMDVTSPFILSPEVRGYLEDDGPFQAVRESLREDQSNL
jgi:hypothetical protein